MNKEIKEILEELEEKNETYKECSENGIIENEYYKSHLLLDYITNLQEEKERLVQVYTDEYNLRHKLSLELSIEKDKTLELSNHLSMYSSEETLLKQIDTYKSRINKAIEKLESIRVFGLRSGKTLFSTLINESIDILKGDPDE